MGEFRRPGGGFLFRVEKEPKDARGAAQDGHFVSIFAVPLEPPLRGLPLEVGRVVPARKILVAGVNSRRATSSSRISYPSLRPDRAKLAHSIAPPLQRKPATLGFALGAAFGGLLDGKFRMVRFHNCAWVCRTNASGSFSP